MPREKGVFRFPRLLERRGRVSTLQKQLFLQRTKVPRSAPRPPLPHGNPWAVVLGTTAMGMDGHWKPPGQGVHLLLHREPRQMLRWYRGMYSLTISVKSNMIHSTNILGLSLSRSLVAVLWSDFRKGNNRTGIRFSKILCGSDGFTLHDRIQALQEHSFLSMQSHLHVLFFLYCNCI